MAKPWLTSDDLIESVQRKIAMPVSSVTFTEDDILAFCNEEMALSQVPSILQYHEEYLVSTKTVAMVTNQSRYPIPDRAIGMKLRDLFWQDTGGNLFKMTQCSEEDKATYQRTSAGGNVVYTYYMEGNDVVLTPGVTADPTGSLVFSFFLRPNQLVRNSKAATITSFSKTVVIANATLVAGDTLTIDDVTLTAVASGATSSQFNIGASSALSATNIATALNTLGGSVTATASTATVTFTYSTLSTEFTTSNDVAFVISDNQIINFDAVPTTITNSSYVDFLQTKPGHKIRAYEVLLSSSAVSGTTITFSSDDVPTDLVVGDYVCSENECIIPQIPPDLHNGLAERACARILASMGDMQGLQVVNEKIMDIDKRQGTLLDNRVDGSPRKIVNRNSLLNGSRRRY